ncbi:MAG: hypothetical protein Q9190_000347, partial [Brigantiaea leucoxantha]
KLLGYLPPPGANLEQLFGFGLWRSWLKAMVSRSLPEWWLQHFVETGENIYTIEAKFQLLRAITTADETNIKAILST